MIHVFVSTGKLVLAVDKELTYVKLDQEHISSISTQVFILLLSQFIDIKHVGAKHLTPTQCRITAMSARIMNKPMNAAKFSYNSINKISFFFCTDASICSVVYSHDGTQLAVGLSTGEVKVSDPLSNQHLFTLRDPVTHTKVRFYVYTPNLYKHNHFFLYIYRTPHQQPHLPILRMTRCLQLGIKTEL